MVLALPWDFPARPLLINLTFGVVLFTLLVQTLTMETLLRRLAIIGTDANLQAFLSQRAQLLMHLAAQRELRRLAEDAALSPRVYKQLEATYLAATQRLEDELEETYQKRGEFIAEELRFAREQLLRVEKTTLQDLQRRGLVNIETGQRLMKAVDSQLLTLASEMRDDVISDPTIPELEATAEHKTAVPPSGQAPQAGREGQG
jgi:CPA1 family monovalent cation:H+ antiporter